MARNAMKKKEPQRINADAPFVLNRITAGDSIPSTAKCGHLAISA